jgi:hypothetical protein
MSSIRFLFHPGSPSTSYTLATVLGALTGGGTVLLPAPLSKPYFTNSGEKAISVARTLPVSTRKLPKTA